MASGQEFVILISIFLAVSSAQNGVRGKKNKKMLYFLLLESCMNIKTHELNNTLLLDIFL